MLNLSCLFISLLLVTLSFNGFSQRKASVVSEKQKRWQHLDPVEDTVYGISMDRAYRELLNGRKKRTVIVGVLDSGTDTLHPDLRPVLWSNSKEMGSDEDGNGYINDRHGWNFLGVKKGGVSTNPGFEYQRIYLSLKNKCGSYLRTEQIKPDESDCISWLEVKELFKKDSAEKVGSNFDYWRTIEQDDSSWKKILGKEVYRAKDLIAHQDKGNKEQIMLSLLSRDTNRTNVEQLQLINEARSRLIKRYSQHPVQLRLETTGDDYNNLHDKYYGDPYVTTGGNHGTHVAGIIGAVRNNSTGIDGIADAVQLMIVRAVYSGADEYDKDVALAIRYAVDNGAKVINMSFGKSFSLQQRWVEDAIRYAAKHDVLLIHSAGNDGVNIDSARFYPTSKYLEGGFAPTMITVGASDDTRSKLIAPFSNYGKQMVDVFAPGSRIYSTVTKNNLASYDMMSGTSMAGPVVAGLAAVLRSYFPELTARQVKYIIENSVTKIDGFVTKPGTKNEQVLMSELCKTAGIVNAYKAVQLTEDLLSNKRKFKKVVRHYFEKM